MGLFSSSSSSFSSSSMARAVVVLAIICCSLPCSAAVQAVHLEGDRSGGVPPPPQSGPTSGCLVRCRNRASPAAPPTASALLAPHRKTLQKHAVVDLYYAKAPSIYAAMTTF